MKHYIEKVFGIETDKTCSSKLQRKYFNVYLQAMKHSGRNVGSDNFNNYLNAVLANDTKQMNECAEPSEI